MKGWEPTHFIDRESGSDDNDGASPERAWRTLGKALSDAPQGAVVRVGPGWYPGSGCWHYITFVASRPVEAP